MNVHSANPVACLDTGERDVHTVMDLVASYEGE